MQSLYTAIVIDVMDVRNLSNKVHCQYLPKNKGGAVLAVHFIGGTVYKEDVVKHSSVTNVKWCTHIVKNLRES